MYYKSCFVCLVIFNYFVLLIPTFCLLQSFKPLRIFYLFSVLGEKLEEVNLGIPKIYEPIYCFHQLRNRLNKFLQTYNENVRGTGMDMVFFEDAMIHLVKVQFYWIDIFYHCCSFPRPYRYELGCVWKWVKVCTNQGKILLKLKQAIFCYKSFFHPLTKY